MCSQALPFLIPPRIRLLSQPLIRPLEVENLVDEPAHAPGATQALGEVPSVTREARESGPARSGKCLEDPGWPPEAEAAE